MMGAGQANAAEPGDEAAFVSMANQSRSQAGLSNLRSPVWVSDARTHSEQMASSGSIFHDSGLQSQADGVSSCWTKVGENVGMGGSPDEIHNAFMNSPTHRSNILGDYDSIGVGVVRTGTGMFVTQRFMKGSSCGAGASQPAPAAPVRLATAPSAPVTAPAPRPKAAPVAAPRTAGAPAAPAATAPAPIKKAAPTPPPTPVIFLPTAPAAQAPVEDSSSTQHTTLQAAANLNHAVSSQGNHSGDSVRMAGVTKGVTGAFAAAVVLALLFIFVTLGPLKIRRLRNSAV